MISMIALFETEWTISFIAGENYLTAPAPGWVHPGFQTDSMMLSSSF